MTTSLAETNRDDMDRPAAELIGTLSERSHPPRWWLHTALYGVLLAVVTLAIPLESSLGTDDGAYGGQVFALQQGDWTLERPLPVVGQDNEGWFNSAITPDGPLPYTSNPSYAVLLRFTADAVDTVRGTDDTGPRSGGDNALGLQLVPVIGALAAAVTAWLLAAQWRRSAAPLAFWLVALGPVIVNSTSMWAHTLSTAAAGAAAVGLVKLLDPDRERSLMARIAPFALWMAGLAVAAAIRTESLLWIAAVCVVVVVVERTPVALAIATAGALGSGAVWIGNRAWGAALRADRLPIVTNVNELQESPGWLQSRIPAAWELLLTTIRPGPGPVLVLVAGIVVGYFALRLRQGIRAGDPGSASIVAPLLLAAAAMYGLVIVVVPGQLLAGTLLAWPLVFLLLFVTASAPSAAEDRDQRLLLWSSGLFVALVVATQYASSGGLQWGGRYLSMAYVPLAVLAAVRGQALVRQYRLPMLALLVAPTLVGMAATNRLHVTHETVMAEVTHRPSDVVISDVRPLTRLGWTELPTAFYFAEAETIESLLVELAEAGVETVNVLGLSSVELDGTAGYQLTGEHLRVRHLDLTSNR